MITYEAIKIEDKMFCNIWANVMHEDRPLTLGEQRTIVREVRAIEDKLKALPNICGWAAWIENDHIEVAKAVQRLGAVKSLSNDDSTWYIKEIG